MGMFRLDYILLLVVYRYSAAVLSRNGFQSIIHTIYDMPKSLKFGLLRNSLFGDASRVEVEENETRMTEMGIKRLKEVLLLISTPVPNAIAIHKMNTPSFTGDLLIPPLP